MTNKADRRKINLTWLILVTLITAIIVVNIQPVAAAKATVNRVKVTNVNNNKLTIVRGKKYTLKTNVAGTGNSPKAVTFKSSNPEIVFVDARGVLNALKNGTAKITVASNAGKTRKAVVTVTVVTSVPKAILTIIDDDGNINFYTDIYPLARQKQIPISTAVPAAFAGKKNHMTWDQIAECKRNGIEVLCHTNSHPLHDKVDQMTEDDFYADYSKAIDAFDAHGIKVDLLVFSGSTGLSGKAQKSAKKLFKGAFLSGDNHVNQKGTDPYKIKRYRIGSTYSWNVQTLEGLVDSLKESGGWMVWSMHTSDRKNYSTNVPIVLGEVIDYCKEQGIEIVTASYGFKKYCK